MEPKSKMIGLPSPRILRMIRFGMPRITRKEFNDQVEEANRRRAARGDQSARRSLIGPRKTGS